MYYLVYISHRSEVTRPDSNRIFSSACGKEFQKKNIQMVVLRLGSSTDKMIEVFKKQYQRNGTDALRLQVFDARKDARQLRCIVSSASAASYGSSVLKLAQAKAVHGTIWNFTVDHSLPNWASVDQWHVVEARLFTYFMEDLDDPLQKTSRPFSALIAPTPFGKGAMRYAFYVVDQENRDRKYVGKVYQFEDPIFQQKSTYEGDMGSQAVASYLAKEFNVRYPESPIEFVQAQLVDLGDDTGAFPFRYMALEPWIPGKYEKFTSNAGHIAKDSDLAQAYSHFTWQATAGEIMVVDIQGVENTLTDPQIHSLDDRFGRGNLSSKGMDAFFLHHRCNGICSTLKLEPHPLQPGVSPPEVQIPHHHIGSIVEEPNNGVIEGSKLPVDWMPMPGSKLAVFLDTVRKDAEDLASHATSESQGRCCLGGAVLQWNNGPEIVEVQKGSHAKEAGCEPGMLLKLVGGKPVGQMAKQDVLQLLAGENNMIVGMATVQKIQTMLGRHQAKKSGELEALMALKELAKEVRALLKAGPLQGVKGLKDLFQALSEDSAEEEDVKLRKHLFLDSVRDSAAKKVQTPDAADGWDERLAVPCDTLAGATFAWTSPPQVTLVLPGSPAEGVVREGQKLVEIDHADVQSLPRDVILDRLRGCSGMVMRLQKDLEQTRLGGFDGQNGLETSALGPLTVRWSEPPLILGEEPQPEVLLSINGASVFGLSQEEIKVLYEKDSSQTPTLSLHKLSLHEDLPGHKDAAERPFKEDRVPVHVGFKCSGCNQKPLVGARFTCKVCATHFCSACFKGRAHAHPQEHQFTVQDFPGTTPIDALAAPRITEGATVVVIGTGQKQLDGKLGLVAAVAPASSGALPLWSVVMDGAPDDAVSMEGKHLFLQSGGAQPAAESVAYHPEPPSDEPKAVEPVQQKPIDPRFTLVRQPSLRELRQIEGQEALERLKVQGPHTARKSYFLCKGMCGTMVEKDKQQYIKEGQMVMCVPCMKKSQESEKTITCTKCGNRFVYSQFLVDLGERAVPKTCQECQEEGRWTFVSPLVPKCLT